jgi:hypothetical protein
VIWALAATGSADGMDLVSWYTLEALVFWVVVVVLIVLAVRFLMKRDWLGRKKPSASPPAR